jgi:hypothetical protein
LFGKVFVVDLSIKLKAMGDWIDRTPPANDIPIEGSWSTMSPHDHFVVICFFVFIIAAFLLRKTPLSFLWKMVVMFFIVLFATILATKIKNDLKEWWNEK